MWIVPARESAKSSELGSPTSRTRSAECVAKPASTRPTLRTRQESAPGEDHRPWQFLCFGYQDSPCAVTAHHDRWAEQSTTEPEVDDDDTPLLPTATDGGAPAAASHRGRESASGRRGTGWCTWHAGYVAHPTTATGLCTGTRGHTGAWAEQGDSARDARSAGIAHSPGRIRVAPFTRCVLIRSASVALRRIPSVLAVSHDAGGCGHLGSVSVQGSLRVVCACLLPGRPALRSQPRPRHCPERTASRCASPRAWRVRTRSPNTVRNLVWRSGRTVSTPASSARSAIPMRNHTHTCHARVRECNSATLSGPSVPKVYPTR